jgi:argininosuccinate lyase
LTELLGFDKLVEPTYDGEAGQDYAMNTLFAVSNIMITLSRAAMDHSIWGMDGYRTHTVSGPHLRPSSMMPHKAHSGVAYENIRMWANSVVTGTMNGILGLKGEPHADVMPSYLACKSANSALRSVEMTMVVFGDIIETMDVDKERLLQLTRDGWGCTPDLVVKLVRDKGYGGRRAHRICAVMVRIAREHRGLKPYELTGAMLDEAARVANEKEPGLTTEEIREIMDPVRFIERHDNTGDPNPKETARMVKIRREQLAGSRARQAARCRKIEVARERLDREVAAICTP